MIGVIASSAEEGLVREFFELLKTPWEFYRKDRYYEVVLCAGDEHFEGTAKVVLVYAGRRTHFDDEQNIQTGPTRRRPCIFTYERNQIPIYADTIVFSEKVNGVLTDEGSHECTGYLDQSGETVLARIGYDLFTEVRVLLTVGQPAAKANIPTLELHIAFLRDLITRGGASLVEIPPIPNGYSFIACLTHDVDHPSIRLHKWDHTMFGFLYRAVFGSLSNLIRGRISVRGLITNWAATLKLPFVHMGLAKDFWRDFPDRYLEMEDNISATFFIIPFKNYSGKSTDGVAPKFRATRYEASDIADLISKLTAAGCEIGLHGIDAWLDVSKGHEELQEIRRLAGASEIGVRMHWLYHDDQSPMVLEEAGASYDSTVGYNETVGYRAGTTQVYKPLHASRLLELPMHVMDTALFYLQHLNLPPLQAKILLRQMGDNAMRFGGCLTVNWHDRSMCPERLWGACYRDLIQDAKSRGAWFATAGQATAWFRKRRSAVFETDCSGPSAVRVKVGLAHGNNLPGLRLRIHGARKPGAIGAYGSASYIDTAIDETVDTQALSEAIH